MNVIERIVEEVKDLPEFRAHEVLDFVGYLKTKSVSSENMMPHSKAGDVDADADWAEFEKLAGTWSGKFNREECYDRASLR